MAEEVATQAPETVTATVRGIPIKVFDSIKQLATEAGVIRDAEKSASDAIRWALVQAYGNGKSVAK